MVVAYLLAGAAWVVRRAGRAAHELGWSIPIGRGQRENRVTQLGQTLISIAYGIERRADQYHDRSWPR